MERLQQLAATKEAHSDSKYIIRPTVNRTGTSNPVTGNHAEKGLEAAATVLTPSKPVLYSKEDIEAAYILLDMKDPNSFLGSDGERTITDSERTITAEPTPVTTPTRPAAPPTPNPAPDQSIEDASMLLNTADTSVSLPPVKRISLKEYVAMKKARKDREA